MTHPGVLRASTLPVTPKGQDNEKTNNSSKCKYVGGAVRVTHRSERVEQVVERPGNDDDVVDVEPEGQHNGGYSNTWERRRSSISVN